MNLISNHLGGYSGHYNSRRFIRFIDRKVSILSGDYCLYLTSVIKGTCTHLAMGTKRMCLKKEWVNVPRQ